MGQEGPEPPTRAPGARPDEEGTAALRPSPVSPASPALRVRGGGHLGPAPSTLPQALSVGGWWARPESPSRREGGGRRPRTCRESSRNAAWKSCLSGAGRQLRLRRPGPAGAGAGALLSSRAAQGRILPGRGAGPRRGPRCTPGLRPRARRATACAARWAKRRSARGRRGRACARVKAGEAVRTARRRQRGWVPRPGPELCVVAAAARPLPPRPAPGGDPTPRPAPASQTPPSPSPKARVPRLRTRDRA